MKRHPQDSELDSLDAAGGGQATASGISFQGKIGAWFAIHLLSERQLEARLTGNHIQSLRFETEAPVDDILVETEVGWIFVQVKSNLSLSSKPDSELAKVASQFVRLWLACSTDRNKPPWKRSLKRNQDQLILALGPNAPRTLSINLARGLIGLQASSSAPLPKAQKKAVSVFKKQLKEAWETITGQVANNDDIHSIINLVTVLSFDFEGAYQQLAVEMLLTVLDVSESAEAAFYVIAQHCQALMERRLGCNMHDLRSSLIAKNIPLAAPPSYQADIRKLQEYSENIQMQLSHHGITKIADKEIHIERQCADVVVDAGQTGPLLLVGEPGAGKSAVLNTSATKLKNQGFNVLVLAADQLPVNTMSDLKAELQINHPLTEVLRNWPSSGPAFLFIDALDATRGGTNEAIFRMLIKDVLGLEVPQWNVIASVRTFDLRMGVELGDLFRGVPPHANLSDAAFQNVAHVHIPPWTPGEFEQLLQESPELSTAIDVGGERLRELSFVPFNTRLIADLITSGLDPSNFRDIRNQTQLFNLYWDHRIGRHGTKAELCLRSTVTNMVESRSLRARKLDVAQPCPEALDRLLHENVLVLQEQRFVTFRHHVLFDYAASRVYLYLDDLPKTIDLLSRGSGLGLTLAPALAFALLDLWNNTVDNRHSFWEAIIRLCGDTTCDPIARSVAARIASELPSELNDVIGLSAELSKQGESKECAVTALFHVIGALVIRLEDEQQVFFSPWCELAACMSEEIQDTAWPLRALLYALYEHITSEAQRDKLGRAARKLLSYCLDSEDVPLLLTSAAIDFVATFYGSNVSKSRQLLQRIFDPEHFQSHAHEELPTLAQNLEPISNADLDFVAEIYTAAFSLKIVDDSKTLFHGSQILPLTSTRHQDYEHSLWNLKEFFPRFLNANSRIAVRALIRVVSDYIEHEQTMYEKAETWNLPVSAGSIRLREDNSHIWTWGIEQDNNDHVYGLIRAYVEYLGNVGTDEARYMIQEIIRANEFAVLWARTLVVASKRAKDVGDLLWPIATQEPFLTSPDVREYSIEFIAARYPLENTVSRRAFEGRVIEFKFQHFEKSEAYRCEILSMLFSCVGTENLVTSTARKLVQERTETERLRSSDPQLIPHTFDIDSSEESSEEKEFLARTGVETSSPQINQIRIAAKEIVQAVGLEDPKDEVADTSHAISLTKILIETTDSNFTNLPERVTRYAYGIAAQALAKLSSLSSETITKDEQTLRSLVDLTIRLAEIPTKSYSVEEERSFEKHSSWGSPDACVEIAKTVMQLCKIKKATVVRLRSTMEIVLHASHPAARMQVAIYLGNLWNSDRLLMWQLADQVARKELNRAVLYYYASYFLTKILHVAPQRVEQLSLTLYRRTFDREEEETKKLLREIGNLIASLWIYHGQRRSLRILKDWIADPYTHTVELERAITAPRHALTLKYRKESFSNVEITQRAQEFFTLASAAIAQKIKDCGEPPQPEKLTNAGDGHYVHAVSLLEQLCSEVYFSAEAFRSDEQKKSPLKTDEYKRDFLSSMQPVLAYMADVGAPLTIYRLVELLDFLIPGDPYKTFDLIADALLVAGSKHQYQFESLAAGHFVKTVGRYMADYREVFSDKERQEKLIKCLELFMEAGWPSARRLLYRLPELLQ